VTSPPPQDIPLGLVDARTASYADVVEGDAVIDATGRPEFRFGSSIYRANPKHRWIYFSNMRPDEALVFKAFDSDLGRVQGCRTPPSTIRAARPAPRALELRDSRLCLGT
jgi:hypothetical protein